MAVGVLGLGTMGRRMAGRLLEETGAVHVWNRTPNTEAAEALRQMGAEVHASPSHLAAQCETVYAMVSTPEASLHVANAASEGVRSGGAKYVDCSTVDAATYEAVAAAVGADNFLAAPVSGGWRDAAAGTLLFVCGGPKDVYNTAEATMSAMGHKRWLVGDSPRHAAHAKLCLQVLMGGVVASLAECHALAEAAGLDTASINDIVAASAMSSPLVRAKSQLMEAKAFPPNFQVYLQHKDLVLATALASDLRLALPVTSAARSLYSAAAAAGLSSADFAAVRAAVAPTTGTEHHHGRHDDE